MNGHPPRASMMADVERALLGGLMLAPDRLDEVVDLRPEHFERPQHGRLLRMLRRMAERGSPSLAEIADEVNAVAEDAEMRVLRGGPVSYVLALPNEAQVEAIPSQARRVIAAHQRRDLRRRLAAAQERLDRGDELLEVVRDVEAAGVVVRTADTQDPGFESYGDLADAELGHQMAQTRPDALSTGYPDLDRQLGGGLQAGQLIVIAARPAMGKSALALNIALGLARNGHGVACYSAEMVAEAVTRRLLAAHAGVPASALRDRTLDSEQYRALTTAVEQAQALPLVIDGKPGRTLSELRGRLRRVQFAGGAPLRVLIVDYLQLLRPDGRGQSREVEVAGIARGLKELALGVPGLTVIALAQLNRAVESRSEHRPGTADLRESGEIEQAADVVALLYRDEVYNPDSPERGVCEVIIGKQRDGNTGTVRLAWLGDRQQFASLAREWRPEAPAGAGWRVKRK